MGLFGSDKNLAAQYAELQGLNAELGEKQAAAVALVEEKSAMISALEAQLVEANAKLETVSAKDAEIAELKAKLANPPAAYADASEGKAEAVAEGGEAGKTYWEQYYAIKDGAERTRFWRKHRNDLENEQRHGAK